MILALFLIAILGAIVLVISQLADVSASSSLVQSAVTASSYLSALVAILPLTISSLISVLYLRIAFEVGYKVYQSAMWLLRRLPGQS